MDLERQMVCTVTTVNHNPGIADWVTETLHDWSPNVSYRWVREFTETLKRRTDTNITEFDSMSQYWQQALRNNGNVTIADVLEQCTDEGTWRSCFLTTVMPYLRDNRNIIHG